MYFWQKGKKELGAFGEIANNPGRLVARVLNEAKGMRPERSDRQTAMEATPKTAGLAQRAMTSRWRSPALTLYVSLSCFHVAVQILSLAL